MEVASRRARPLVPTFTHRGQTALAVALLTCGGLLLQTFHHLWNTDQESAPRGC